MKETAHQLTIVLKLGSSSILQPTPPYSPQIATLSAVAETCVSLRALGHRVVLVSSGAVGMGLHRMNMPAGVKKRPIGEKQALAAIGQGRVIALWDQLFALLHQPIAQILITRNDIADRSRYRNATTTLATLLQLGVIPIINENDTVSVSEILSLNRFGDNDTLSAIAAGMCAADYLFLLTDVQGLYEDNPRKVPGARMVSRVRDIEEVRRIVSTSSMGTSLGTGGMETKLIAAELATAAGCATVITTGADPARILPIVQAHSINAASAVSSESTGVEFAPSGSASASAASPQDEKEAAEAARRRLPAHTLFLPRRDPLSARRFWVLHGLTPRGAVYIDEGAYRAISRSERAGGSAGNGGRLLAAGVLKVEGDFAAGQAIRVIVVKGHWGRRRTGRSAAGTAPHTPGSATPADDRGRPRSPPHSRPSSPDHHAEREEGQGTAHDDEDDDEEGAPARGAMSGSLASLRSLDELSLEDEICVEVGRGLTNYNSSEIDRIKGCRSSDIERMLGYIESDHVVESIVDVSKPGEAK